MGVAMPHVNRLPTQTTQTPETPKPAYRRAAKRAEWRGKSRTGEMVASLAAPNYDRDPAPKRVGGNSTLHNSTAPRYWPARTAAMS